MTTSRAKLRWSPRSTPSPALSPKQRAARRWLSDNPDRIREVTGELFIKHRAKVIARLMSLGLQRADAEEVCTETFLVAMRKLPDFEGSSSLSSWLCGIARKLAADHRRSARARYELLADELPEVAALGSAEGHAEEVERAEALRREVRGLKPGMREVVQKFCFEGRAMNDVARAMRVPAQTAYARLYAAQRALHRALAPALA